MVRAKNNTQSNFTLHSVILLLIYVMLFFCDYVKCYENQSFKQKMKEKQI